MDSPFRCEGIDSGLRLAFVAQFPVRAVFENQKAELPGKSHKFAALGKGKSFSARVLEIRNGVEEFYLLSGINKCLDCCSPLF